MGRGLRENTRQEEKASERLQSAGEKASYGLQGMGKEKANYRIQRWRRKGTMEYKGVEENQL